MPESTVNLVLKKALEMLNIEDSIHSRNNFTGRRERQAKLRLHLPEAKRG